MNFDFDDEEFERDVKIKVVGVGGGGGNAVENMVRNNVEGVDFIIINTDVAALKSKDGNTMERVQIGRKTTKGRGAGGKPPVAAESAKENSDDIAEVLKGASLVFVARDQNRCESFYGLQKARKCKDTERCYTNRCCGFCGLFGT